jgi:hypothetical protein
VPGLVDGHTHPVWAGDRVAEFAMKLAGATYMQVSSLSSLHAGQLLITPTCRSELFPPLHAGQLFPTLHAGQLFLPPYMHVISLSSLHAG